MALRHAVDLPRPPAPPPLFLVRDDLIVRVEGRVGRVAVILHLLFDLGGDDRSVKIKTLEAAKIMKIEWLVLGCIDADFCK